MDSADLIGPDTLKDHGKILLNDICPFNLKMNEYTDFRSLFISINKTRRSMYALQLPLFRTSSNQVNECEIHSSKFMYQNSFMKIHPSHLLLIFIHISHPLLSHKDSLAAYVMC